MDGRHPEMEKEVLLVQETPILRKWTSRQFITTLIGMALTYHATLQGVNVAPLSTVVIVAITGIAGVNAMERRK